VKLSDVSQSGMPFGGLPVDLAHAALARRPVSLHWSVRSNGLWIALPLVFLSALSYVRHWGMWLPVAVVVVALVVGIRRIDIEGSTLTIVPLLPLFPAQQFRFADLGPFSRKSVPKSPRDGLQSLISDGRSFRAANLWPRRKLSFTAVYGPSVWARSLTCDELLVLVEAYREGAHPE
jgi:hypothetical protein